MEARPVFEHCFTNWNISHDCAALAILEKRFGDSDLKDIFIESQIVALLRPPVVSLMESIITVPSLASSDDYVDVQSS